MGLTDILKYRLHNLYTRYQINKLLQKIISDIRDQDDLSTSYLNKSPTPNQVDELLGSIVSGVANDNDLDKYYKDPFLTAEQDKRDTQITRLLTAYVNGYEEKTNSAQNYRVLIFLSCIGVVIAIACVLRYCIIQVADWENEPQISNLVAFVTACISFVSLIIGLLTIITKFFFPENDEQYITKIVEIIQNNDFKNKQEVRSHPAENGDSVENALLAENGDSAETIDPDTSNPSDSQN